MRLKYILATCIMLSFSVSVQAQQKTVTQAAKQHIETLAPDFGLTATDLTNLSERVTTLTTGGTVVYLQQTMNGLPVDRAVVAVGLNRDGEVISTAGMENLIPTVASKTQGTLSMSSEQAVRAAGAHFGLPTEGAVTRVEQRNSNQFEYTAPWAAGPVYAEPVVSGGQAAWRVYIEPITGPYEEGASGQWWAMDINNSGSVITKRDIYISENWGHGHQAETSEASLAPYREEAEPYLSAMRRQGNYRVFPMPLESPNHGAIADVANPDQDGPQAGRWHLNSGGAQTITWGNNVRACDDRDANNVCGVGSSPDGGVGLNFLFTPDFNMTPSTYTDAAVTNLFYWNNIIHDVLYNYGFDEPGGNFQDQQVAAGGAGSDEVNADAQDGSGTNNANFGTPPDGFNPRMQMFEWTPGAPITVNSPPAVAGDYSAGSCGFCVASPGVTSNLVIPVAAAGAPGTPQNGCGTGAGVPAAYQNAAQMAGNIALIDRGACAFDDKVASAALSGAVGAIVCNNDGGNGTLNMGGTPPPAHPVGIPGAFIGNQDCDLIKTEVAAHAKNGSLVVNATIPPPPVNRDSDYDSGIIVHEYGHGVSNRLTGGPGNVGCLGNQEQMGEGWSDWLGLMFTTTSADNATEPRGIGTYVLGQTTTGNGIRPAPYSTDLGVNPFTYANVDDGGAITIPHGVGFIWSTMLWEMTWNLVNGVGAIPGTAWDNDIYNGTGGNNIAMQLVLDGMKLQSCSPSFVSGRDGIIAASQAMTGGTDTAPAPQECAIWAAFAKRGLGINAMDNGNGIGGEVEDFNYPTACNPLLPVELASFDALLDGKNVLLRWTTLSETDNAGFEVEQQFGDVFRQIGYVDGFGTTNEAQNYTFKVQDLDAGTHVFRLKQVDFDGTFEYTESVEVNVGVPGEYELAAAYPNPFNPSTQFTLAVAADQDVTVAVYNVQGRRVATLHQGPMTANERHTFAFEAGSLPSGLYAIQIIGDTFTASQTVMLQK